MKKINELFSNASISAKRKIHRTGLILKKNEPEIYFGLGVLAFGATIVTVHKAAKKVDSILEQHQNEIDKINQAVELEMENELEPGYKDTGAKRDKLITYVQTAGSLAKNYALPAAFASASVFCFFKAYRIEKLRYVGAVAAFNAVSATFEAYRQRVISEQGADMDRHFMYGTDNVTVNELNEDGSTTEKEIEVIDKLPTDAFARVFDKENHNFTDSYAQNLSFLEGVENVMNDRLITYGHVFLNEVYDQLGFPRTPEGAVVGWILRGPEDHHKIDLGFYNTNINMNRTFLNGLGDSILLDFNHDGVIFEEI